MEDDSAMMAPAQPYLIPQDQLLRLASRLEDAYKTPEPELGNQADPLDEAVYVILTFQTDVIRAQEVWIALKRSFPTWADLESASEEAVADVLRIGGLYHQKAHTIQRLLAKVRQEMGELSLARLHEWDDARVERFLCHLPGLSWKGARCVMLYSLHRSAFPIDVNTFRIFKRLGIISCESVYRRLSLHNALQEAVVPDRRRSLHVNLVIHGRRVCLPHQPRCSLCAIRDICDLGSASVTSLQAADSGEQST